MAAGVTGLIGATVLACSATPKADKIYKWSKRDLEVLSADESDLETTRERSFVAASSLIEIFKLYLPAAVVGALSVAALLKSRSVLTKRTAGLAAAYKLADEAYKRYRQRVVDKFGDDVDVYLRAVEEETERKLRVVEETEEEGVKKFELTVDEAHMLGIGVSQYAKFFDDTSPQWRSTNQANLFFLRAQQTNLNVQLRVRGHVFLNEAYDVLGIPRTTAGSVVGWIDDGSGDSIISFGIFNDANDYNDDVLNHRDRNEILLDFNVDGLIYDRL